MSGIVVRPMVTDDLAEADRINRIAFGTFFSLDDPGKFRGDGDAVHGRFDTNPDGSFSADLDGRMVACGFVSDWGGVGILGPLTVDVDYWGRGIARKMLDSMIEYMDTKKFGLRGLFTHPQSATHIRLYETYGFWMQRITAVMDKTVEGDAAMPGDAVLFSSLTGDGQAEALASCRGLTQSIYPSLDVSGEILSIHRNRFGDTILLGGENGLDGFACCHQGAMSEAGSLQTLVKFAAIRPGSGAAESFSKLSACCEGFAVLRGTARLVAGTNTGREECYKALLKSGFRTWMNGIAMICPDDPGYNVPGAYVIDDWR
jgi:GNAT superfamily N-acetyltransferase